MKHITTTTVKASQPELNHGGLYRWFFRPDAGRMLQEEQLRKLSLAVEQSPSSVVMTDAQGRIDYVNPKFCSLTGFTAEEVRGRNVRMLKSGRMPPEIFRRLWDTILAGQEWRGEFHNKKKNGESYWELASISPLLDAAGQVTHFVSVKEDITEQRRLEAERDNLLGELHEALQDVHALKDLVPVCGWCKKIRVDHDYWKKVETFIATHTAGQCSHSICPACETEHFPGHPQHLGNRVPEESGSEHWGLNE
jgi:PAS domain S-box-containing protein